MSAGKWTKGPWKYEASTKTIRAVPANYWLATMDSWERAVNHEANAHLIAAAPLMAEALEAAIRWHDSNSLETMDVRELAKWIGIARAALRKARGEV